jgi:enamine deaminase RidA (YjgF/YER057c/UK114 family)
MTIQRFDKGPRMSQAVVHGDTVYLAGLVAEDTSEDVAGQTRQILAQAERRLAQAGSAKSKILRVQIWLSDIATFDQMNGVYDAWVDKENPPARACVEARLAAPKYLIEIMMTAAR